MIISATIKFNRKDLKKFLNLMDDFVAVAVVEGLENGWKLMKMCGGV
jgi:hypothetical protein